MDRSASSSKDSPISSRSRSRSSPSPTAPSSASSDLTVIQSSDVIKQFVVWYKTLPSTEQKKRLKNIIKIYGRDKLLNILNQLESVIARGYDNTSIETVRQLRRDVELYIASPINKRAPSPSPSPSVQMDVSPKEATSITSPLKNKLARPHSESVEDSNDFQIAPVAAQKPSFNVGVPPEHLLPRAARPESPPAPPAPALPLKPSDLLKCNKDKQDTYENIHCIITELLTKNYIENYTISETPVVSKVTRRQPKKSTAAMSREKFIEDFNKLYKQKYGSRQNFWDLEKVHTVLNTFSSLRDARFPNWQTEFPKYAEIDQQRILQYDDGKLYTGIAYYLGQPLAIHKDLDTNKSEPIDANDVPIFVVVYDSGELEDASLSEFTLKIDYKIQDGTTRSKYNLIKNQSPKANIFHTIVNVLKTDFINNTFVENMRAPIERTQANHKTILPYLFPMEAHLNYINYLNRQYTGIAPIGEGNTTVMNLKYKTDLQWTFNMNISNKDFYYLNKKYDNASEFMNINGQYTIADYVTPKSIILQPSNKTLNYTLPINNISLNQFFSDYLFNPQSSLLPFKNTQERHLISNINKRFLSLGEDSPFLNIQNIHTLPFKALEQNKTPQCICYLCGKAIPNTPENTIDGSIDHIIPVMSAYVLGILNTPFNYAPTHRACNTSKLNSVPEMAPYDRSDAYKELLSQSIKTQIEQIKIQLPLSLFEVSHNDAEISGGFPIRTKGRRQRTLRHEPYPSVIAPGTPEPTTPRFVRNLTVMQHRLDIAKECASYFQAAIKAQSEKLDTLPGVLTFFILREIGDFFNAIVFIKGHGDPTKSPHKMRGGNLSASATTFLRGFTNTYKGSDEELWIAPNRINFINFRYEAVYEFSHILYENLYPATSYPDRSYLKFITDRIDSLLKIILEWHRMVESTMIQPPPPPRSL